VRKPNRQTLRIIPQIGKEAAMLANLATCVVRRNIAARKLACALFALATATGVGCASTKKAPDLAGPRANAYYGAAAKPAISATGGAADAVAAASSDTSVVPASAEVAPNLDGAYPVQQAIYQGEPHKRVVTMCGPGCSCR
jgi:hypothetical protein